MFFVQIYIVVVFNPPSKKKIISLCFFLNKKNIGGGRRRGRGRMLEGRENFKWGAKLEFHLLVGAKSKVGRGQ